MSEPFKLFQLQQIDSKIDQINKRKTEINTALSNNQIVLNAQKLVKKAESGLNQTNLVLKSAENVVQEQKVKIDQNQAALYGGKVTNPKELQDLQAEAVSLKSYLEVLEERQLEAMLEFEDSEEKHQAAVSALEAAQSEASAENKDLSAELAGLEENLSRSTATRENMLPQIPGTDLETYQKIRDKRAGIAVARLTGINCAACGTTLARALAQAAKSPTKLSFCTTCGRILYGK